MRRQASFLQVVGGLDFIPAEANAPLRPLAAPRRKPAEEPATSATAVNSRLRSERGEMWARAGALTRYWRALLDLETAISFAEHRDALPQSVCRLPCDREVMLAKWREAVAQQMRTPAYDLTSLKWKQDALARGAYDFTGVTPERLKGLIADDEAWLAEHPTRRTKDRIQA